MRNEREDRGEGQTTITAVEGAPGAEAPKRKRREHRPTGRSVGRPAKAQPRRPVDDLESTPIDDAPAPAGPLPSGATAGPNEQLFDNELAGAVWSHPLFPPELFPRADRSKWYLLERSYGHPKFLTVEKYLSQGGRASLGRDFDPEEVTEDFLLRTYGPGKFSIRAWSVQEKVTGETVRRLTRARTFSIGGAALSPEQAAGIAADGILSRAKERARRDPIDDVEARRARLELERDELELEERRSKIRRDDEDSKRRAAEEARRVAAEDEERRSRRATEERRERAEDDERAYRRRREEREELAAKEDKEYRRRREERDERAATALALPGREDPWSDIVKGALTKVLESKLKGESTGDAVKKGAAAIFNSENIDAVAGAAAEVLPKVGGMMRNLALANAIKEGKLSAEDAERIAAAAERMEENDGGDGDEDDEPEEPRARGNGAHPPGFVPVE